MFNMKPLKHMKRTGMVSDNVCCGLVNWKGEQLYGCGAKPVAAGYTEFVYEHDTIKVFSTVNLCPKCIAAIKEQD